MAIRPDYKAKKATAINPSGTTATVFKQVDDSTKPAAVFVPAGAKLIRVRASGVCTGGTTTNFTPKLQIGTSTTAASNTDLANLTARAFNSASGQWLLDVLIAADTVNTVLNGTISGFNGTTPTIEAAAIFTQVATQSFAASGKSICVAGTFSAGNAANTSTLDFLTLEVMA